MSVNESDARLKDAVLRELRQCVNAAKIGVAVDHAVVTLTGWVDTETEKVAAQEATHRAVGVLDVANDIYVKAPFRLGSSDSDLAEAVRRALREKLPGSAEHIHSTVYDARVTLEGMVDFPCEREDAERAVLRLAFVRGLDNKITVRAKRRSAMSAGRICLRDVDTAELGEKIVQAARRMRERDVGTLVVIDDSQRPVGILTDRDVVTRVVAVDRGPTATTVGDVMTSAPKTVSEDTPIEVALARMRAGGFRRILVVDRDEKLVGILTLDDVLALLCEEFSEVGSLLQHQTPHHGARV